MEKSENRKSVEETHVDQNGRDGLNWFQLVDGGLKTSTSKEKNHVLDALKWTEQKQHATRNTTQHYTIHYTLDYTTLNKEHRQTVN